MDEKQVGDHLVERKSPNLLGFRVHGAPQEDRRQHRQETKDGVDEEVGAVDHALDERGAEDAVVFAHPADKMARFRQNGRLSRLHGKRSPPETRARSFRRAAGLPRWYQAPYTGPE